MRVVVAEDTMLTREGLVRLLEGAGVEVVEQVEDGDALLRKVAATKPDVAIVDIKMPPTHTDEGLVAAQRIRTQHPAVGVLVLSQYVEPGYAAELLADGHGGVGYLLKERVGDTREFVDAVRRVAAGGAALDPEVVAQFVALESRGPLQQLTAREREVLALMAEGRSNAAIANAMVVTPGAVEKHVTAIFGKLGLVDANTDNRRVLAVLAYLRAAEEARGAA
jgi:DNA-binding NarL/FixJ family response regulator